METNERRHNYILTGLSIGAALGGAAGLFFAPKSGRELRTGIKTTGDKVFNETNAFIGKAQHQISDARQRARNVWSCVKEKVERAPQHGTESSEESFIEA